MRNIITIVILISFLIISCAKKNDNSDAIAAFREEFSSFDMMAAQDGVIEIRERMFATQVNDIYINARDYLGKTIKYEGIFVVEQAGGESKYFVARNGPGGCCGDDAMVGFEIRGSDTEEFPDGNSWVEVTGVLKEFAAGFQRYLYVELSSLVVLNRRGLEFVSR